MEVDPRFTNFKQPPSLPVDHPEVDFSNFEPEYWRWVENLIQPDASMRLAGFNWLAKNDAARSVPLVAYTAATRLSDPDMRVRSEAVALVAGLFLVGGNSPTPETVLVPVMAYLAQMRTRQVYALLQVALVEPARAGEIDILLNHCPHAGNHLAALFGDRKMSMAIRKAAIDFIGRVGYLSTIPALDRLAQRLEGKLSGQQTLSFSQIESDEEVDLLPGIRHTLLVLRSP